MPVNNFQQARIDLSKAQAKAVAELFKSTMEPSISLEETNISNCVAVIKGVTVVALVHHNGEVHYINEINARAVKKPSIKAGRPR